MDGILMVGIWDGTRVDVGVWIKVGVMDGMVGVTIGSRRVGVSEETGDGVSVEINVEVDVNIPMSAVLVDARKASGPFPPKPNIISSKVNKTPSRANPIPLSTIHFIIL